MYTAVGSSLGRTTIVFSLRVISWFALCIPVYPSTGSIKLKTSKKTSRTRIKENKHADILVNAARKTSSDLKVHRPLPP